jgi:hypothetical protein
MFRLYFLMALLATSISALPLNINLGAYSPALVVGDGEISFGGKQDVSNLMNALEGAAVTSAATANGQAAAAPAAAAPAAAKPQAANTQEQVAPAVAENSEAQVTALQGMGKEIAPRIVKLEKSDSEVEKRDIQTLNAALSYASGALKNGPEIQLGTEAAGVGILQKPSTGAAVAAAPANGAAKAVVGRREVVSDAKLKTTVTTMFIRGGPAG